MLKSILAVSEGGPDAGMSFKLASRVAGLFDGTVDALHLPVGPAGGMVGGLAMSGEAMPLIMDIDDERLEARAQESERVYKEIVAPVKGATFTAAKTATLDTLVAMGRCSDVLVLGRPGADPENVAPATVEAAIYECARPVMIAPPEPGAGEFANVIVAWNGSFQAARTVEYSLPFLGRASQITILVVGSTPDDVGAARRQVLQIFEVHPEWESSGGVRGVEARDAAIDQQAAERHDERLHPFLGNEETVNKPHQNA